MRKFIFEKIGTINIIPSLLIVILFSLLLMLTKFMPYDINNESNAIIYRYGDTGPEILDSRYMKLEGILQRKIYALNEMKKVTMGIWFMGDITIGIKKIEHCKILFNNAGIGYFMTSDLQGTSPDYDQILIYAKSNMDYMFLACTNRTIVAFPSDNLDSALEVEKYCRSFGNRFY